MPALIDNVDDHAGGLWLYLPPQGLWIPHGMAALWNEPPGLELLEEVD